MAAEDVTVSLAAASASIRVTELRRDGGPGTLPKPEASTTVAASGNVVINLGARDAILVERLASDTPVAKELQVSTREQFSV